MATLAHALQVVGAWIAPLIIFLIRRNSRFVSFHALQALLLQIAYMIAMVCFGMFWFVAIFGMVLQHGGKDVAPSPAFLLLMPLAWLGFMGAWVAILVIAILYAIKAGRGEWADYPVFGKLARRLLKIDHPYVTL